MIKMILGKNRIIIKTTNILIQEANSQAGTLKGGQGKIGISNGKREDENNNTGGNKRIWMKINPLHYKVFR